MKVLIPVKRVVAYHVKVRQVGLPRRGHCQAAQCGGDGHVLVAGQNAAATQAAAPTAGVSKVIHAKGAQFPHGLAENRVAQVLAVAGNYSHPLYPATAGGQDQGD